MSTQITPEIFVSYAWEPDSERIVEQFDTACKSRGFRLVRDKTDLQFKGLIKDFMKSIGQGKFVLVILSDKYLKSENCMFELLEIAKNGNFYDRIFPIVTDSTNFYKAVGRVKYIRHWEDEIKELNDAMVGLASQADLAGVRYDIDHYTRIRAMISDLTAILKDMNSLSVQQHVTANFEDVFALIEKDLNKNEYSESPAEAVIEASDKDIADKKKQDKTIANLLKVDFPETIYIARLAIDRNEIIEKSWKTDFKLKRKSSERKVAYRALEFTNNSYQREFHVYNNTIISFYDLNDRTQAYKSIIDKASIESYAVDEFLESNSDYEPVFIALLNICLQEKLRKKEIEWVKNEKCYRFKIGPLAEEKKVTWKGLKQATRTVIAERFNRDKTQIVAFKHLAFYASCAFKLDFI